MGKLPIIESVLKRLADDLGVHAFVIADHWDDDTATAVASPQLTSQLVYFCRSNADDETLFDFELETAPENPIERIYDVAGRGSRVTYEELRDVVRKHLSHVSK